MPKKTKSSQDIHENPTFRGLVDDLKGQTPEHRDRFTGFLDLELANAEANLLSQASALLRRFHDLPEEKQQALLDSLDGKSPAEVLKIVREVLDNEV